MLIRVRSRSNSVFEMSSSQGIVDFTSNRMIKIYEKSDLAAK